jgi:signal transduction histidine kinase
MYKKLSLTFLVFQFTLTLLFQLILVRFAITFEEQEFAKNAQRFFDREGTKPVFCEDDGTFGILRADVLVNGVSVEMAGKSHYLAQWIDGILPLFALWMAISLIASLGLAGGVYVSMEKPLLAIRKAAGEWKENAHVPEIEIFGGDELGQTGKALVESARRVEEKRKEILRYMRHELMNPLTGLRGAAEALLEQTGDDLARLFIRETGRMEQMLLEGTDKEQVQKDSFFSFSSLWISCRCLCSGMAKKQGRKTVLFGGEPLPSYGSGSESAWKSAVLNLQQNALRYSPPDSKTVFGALTTHKGVVFVFYNRIADTLKNGDGSGLKTVASICQEWGGRIVVKTIHHEYYMALLHIPAL